MSNAKQRKTNFTLREQVDVLHYLFGFAKSEVKWFALSVVMMIFSSGLSAYLPIIIHSNGYCIC